MSHHHRTFVPAVPLAREGQEQLVRFLAGREAGQGAGHGAFAAVAALRSTETTKE